jgi:UDP-N-acetylglucosamine 2-epimerase
MGFPAVSIRTSTERPEAIDAGTMGSFEYVSNDSI